jgi:hypothetical protein
VAVPSALADYIWRGPSNLKITKEVDPVSREVVAFHAEWLRSVDRPVYLDNRPHPSPNAPHTWAGFSTAKWEGDMLTVYTTHLKEGYLRRNGLPRSDKATLTEHWIRNGDFLTVMTIVSDPVYLTEPFVRTTDYELNVNQQIPPYPCGVVQEIDREKGQVPSYLFGTNPYLTEFATKHNIPVDATRGWCGDDVPRVPREAPHACRHHLPKQAAGASRGSRELMMRKIAVAAAVALLLGGTHATAQRGAAPQGPPPTARAQAPIDLAGVWVSIVTEDWRWRMITPPKGDYPSVPLTQAGRDLADRWDPAKDAAAG